MNRICNACNIKMEQNNYLEDKTVSKKSYIKNRRKTTIKTQSIINNRKWRMLKITITIELSSENSQIVAKLI